MEDELQVIAGHYVVQIPPAHVHKDVETIIGLLSNESAAPTKWIDVALSYLKNGDLDLCDKILLCAAGSFLCGRGLGPRMPSSIIQFAITRHNYYAGSCHNWTRQMSMSVRARSTE